MTTQQPYHTHTYPNGLKLVLVPMPGVKSATVMVMVGAGSRYETKKISGISHFLEHMAFKGTQKRPSALEISGTIDAIGGEFNAFTSKDHTGFYVKAAATHIPLMLDVLSDMLLNSLLKTDEIEREKGVIVEEINMYKDTPVRHISDMFDELIFGTHQLGWNIAGEPEIIRKITREDFVTYMKGLYRPNNTVLVIAGGLNEYQISNVKYPISKSRNEIIKLVEASLGQWEQGKIWPWDKLKATQNSPRVHVEFKQSEQAHIALGVWAHELEHPTQYATSLLSAILGGGMSSRLFIEVRERRGLGYYVHSNAEHYVDTGAFMTQSGVDVKRIEDAIKVIWEEYEAITSGKKPITPEELTKSKEYLKGRLTLELEDSRSVAGLYATQEILKRKMWTPEEIIAKTDAVKLEEVEAVAKELFVKKHINLAIIGPYKDASRFEKVLA